MRKPEVETVQAKHAAFVLNDVGLSGGVGVLLKHAAALQREPGWHVTVLVVDDRARKWAYPELEALELRPLRAALSTTFDLIVFTWWETLRWAPALRTARAVWLMQSAEDRFYVQDPHRRALAQAALLAPMPRVAIANWIAELVSQVAPACRVIVVPNGIDKETFTPSLQAVEGSDSPLRVVLEGHEDVPFKGMAEAFRACATTKRDIDVTWIRPAPMSRDHPPEGVNRVIGPLSASEMAAEFSQHHVLLKLSRVEGMFAPPLEAFHCGATAIVSEVTGHDEYIRHGENALVVGMDDVAGAAHFLDLLAEDRSLLARLGQGARATAESWPSWSESTAAFVASLEDLCAAETSQRFEDLQLFVRAIWGLSETDSVISGQVEILRNELWHAEHRARHWEHEWNVLLRDASPTDSRRPSVSAKAQIAAALRRARRSGEHMLGRVHGSRRGIR
jgi:O-antigen biosynthesis protein